MGRAGGGGGVEAAGGGAAAEVEALQGAVVAGGCEEAVDGADAWGLGLGLGLGWGWVGWGVDGS